MSELSQLAAFAAALGVDIAQVQGPGGNVSLKQDGVLFVKASGTWLATAQDAPILVALGLDALHAAMAKDGDVSRVPPIAAAGTRAELRPSIETALHAFLPHRVVVHTHSVSTVAHAVCVDAPARLAPKLAGLPWRFVAYARPGTPLLDAVRAAVGDARPDVLVLANHGLVIGADTVADAASLLADVERRLYVPMRAVVGADVDLLTRQARTCGRRLPVDPICHAIAIDSQALARAVSGALYPDHVVFLGPGAPPCGLSDMQAATDAPMVLLPGQGVLLRSDLGAAGFEMVRCLAHVLLRLSPDDVVRVLSGQDEAALMGWDAEEYRRRFDRRPASLVG